MKPSKKNSTGSIKPSFIPVIFLFVAFLTMCAKVSSPPGGPVDQTGAEVIASVPENGAVNVAKSNVVQITFSETVDKNSAQSAIFISPLPDRDLAFKWKGKTLNIILPDTFKDATTYVVNIGANVTDLRKNKMEKSRQLAFSTGPRISTGRVDGFIADQEKAAIGVTVGLFDGITFADLPSFDSLYPAYMTQTGKDGRFQLDYLPDGEYFLLAYGDGNKNQTFDFGQESYGLSDRPVHITDGQGPVTLNISMIKKDTASYHILSITPNGDGLIRVKFTNGLAPARFEGMFESVELTAVDDSGRPAYTPQAIVEGGDKALQNFTVYFGDIAPGKYRLRINKSAFDNISESSAFMESPEFEKADATDNTPPKIVFCSHEGQTVYADNNRIDLKFSEPIQFLDSIQLPFIVVDRDTVGYAVETHFLTPLHCQLHVPDLVEGQNYMLSVNASAIADRSGNALGQSIIDYRFTTYDADSMGTASGRITIDTVSVSKGPVHLQFDIYPSMKTFTFHPTDDIFQYSLPPGKYQLRAYVDRNQNGEYDPGQLYPPELPETWVIYPDTIRIRPRFETAGIELLII